MKQKYSTAVRRRKDTSPAAQQDLLYPTHVKNARLLLTHFYFFQVKNLSWSDRAQWCQWHQPWTSAVLVREPALQRRLASAAERKTARELDRERELDIQSMRTVGKMCLDLAIGVLRALFWKSSCQAGKIWRQIYEETAFLWHPDFSLSDPEGNFWHTYRC